MTALPSDALQKPPLDGITVINMSRVLAGPYCAMILTDHRARQEGTPNGAPEAVSRELITAARATIRFETQPGLHAGQVVAEHPN
jgi:hypothetical protein